MNRQDLLNLFDETTVYCRAVMEAKNNDYCAGEKNAEVDPFANFRIAAAVGVHPVLGLMMRMMDKMQRIRAFVADGKLSVSDETVDDAFDDMVNYAILGKGLMRSLREEQRVAQRALPEPRANLYKAVDDPKRDAEIESHIGDAHF